MARAFEGERVQLASSLYVYDFFADAGWLLASPYPPDSVDLLRAESGEAILPGAPRAILPLGTRVRIEEIHFPSPLFAGRRPEGTPRDAIWIAFTCLERGACPAAEGGRQMVAVIAGEISARADLERRLARLFSFGDPVSGLSRYSGEERAALMAKQLSPGMSPPAAALAWGTPASIRVEWQGGVKVETWRWPLGRRTAVFRGQRLVESSPPLEARAAQRGDL